MATNQKQKSYYETLSAAIDDISKNGYDSEQRVLFWVGELKKAASRTMSSSAQVDQALKDAMTKIYMKMIERGQIGRWHPGVGRFTIEKLRPQLRRELDRSIMASAGLIRLNKEQAMTKTLQRFTGWATSIPPGGSKAVDKAKEKESIRKPVAKIKFEERRVEVDQAHKLVANLNRIIASDGGAIAFEWNSHFRQPGYDYREDHKERDYKLTGKVYLIRNSWAQQNGLVKPMKNVGYSDQITAPGEEIFCSCFVTYRYNLRDLPKEMLTKKGEVALADARAKLKAMGV